MRSAPSDDHPALYLLVRRGEVLVVARSEGFAIPQAIPDVPTGGVHILGSMLDGTWVYGVDVEPHTDEPDEHLWVPLRQLYGKVDDILWTVAGRAEQIVSWDRTHRFCGRCGEPTEPQLNERARKCPSCGLLAYPRLSPATITLVTRGEGADEEALLAWGRQFPGRFYSTLAGFVEPGESLEQCVAREIMEEVGVEVGDIAYFGSQPWPFPNSLMLGFTARYIRGELVLQEDEIVEAGWFRADALPPCPRGGMSIAGALIESWLRKIEALAS
jgi:NAD+ diphosphatase